MTKTTRKMSLIAAVAVLALASAYTASAFAALPEFVPGEGAKWPITFEGTERVGAGWEWANGGLFECSPVASKGEVTGAKAASLTLEWTGCTEESRRYYTKGEPEGTVVIPGGGTLVYISKASKEVGLLFTLKETVKVYREGSVIFKLSGSELIPLTPLDTLMSKFDLPFEKGAKAGAPKYSQYENEKGEVKKAGIVIAYGGIENSGVLEIHGADAVTASKALKVVG